MKKLINIKRYYTKAVSLIDYWSRKFIFLHFRFLVVSKSEKIIKIKKLTIPSSYDPITEYKCQRFIKHEYDILGSGWINTDCNIERTHFLTKTNQKIQSLVDKDYLIHDWHKDFKSGYIWSETEFCKDSLKVVGKIPNLEIKYPWEFSRLYHLPILAIGSHYNNAYSREINNQLIDFYYSNPVGLGVNWSCTMDVGIRIHNILVSLSLNNSSNNSPEFQKLISNLVMDHGNFIYNFLENKSAPNNNHYLANLLGLISIAYYTEFSNKTAKWAVFAYKEFLYEFSIQFNPDGSNFEGSSCYHALSTEMYLLFTAYTLGLSQEYKRIILNQTNRVELFDREYTTKLCKSIQFIKDLSFSNNEMSQIGDNDSGYIFKLTNSGKMYSDGSEMEYFKNLKKSVYRASGQDYWDENLLYKNHLIERYDAICPNSSKSNNSNDSLEKQFILAITNSTFLEVNYEEITPDVAGFEIDLKKYKHQKKHFFKSELDLELGTKIFNYPNFGVCGYKSSNYELIFSYADNGLLGKGGHAHNDKLSFGLSIEGKILFSDPGTYLYHPDPEWRNYFRSTKSHNTILVQGFEQNSWVNGRKGIFRLSNESKSEILYFNRNELLARFVNNIYEHIRYIKIEKNQIIVTDYCDKEFETNFYPNEFYSPGYGKLIQNSVESN